MQRAFSGQHLEEKVYSDEVDKLIEFMNQHNGEMPSINNPDKVERDLAKLYKKNHNKYSEELLLKLNEELNDNRENIEIIFQKYLKFITENKRKPIIYEGINEDELELAYSYNRCYTYFNDNQNDVINSKLKEIGKRIQDEQVYKELYKIKKRGK